MSAVSGIKGAAKPRSRAKRACKACNFRRVRCNVMESRPCQNCKKTGANCEIAESRRGKYDRTAKLYRCADKVAAAVCESDMPAPPRNENARGAENLSHPPLPPDSYTPVSDVVSNVSAIPIMRDESADRCFEPNGFTPNSNQTVSFAASPDGLVREADTSVFVGESSSLRIAHETRNSSIVSKFEEPTLRYPLPNLARFKDSTGPLELARRSARIESLKHEGVFSLPDHDTCQVLLHAYFKWFHPCFPIVDRVRMSGSYVSGTIPDLLYQAVLFIGASYCDKKTLKTLGSENRHEVKRMFYNRAKDIYDADLESDNLIIMQALFLMSFWRAGPATAKDTRHWLGAAISLAHKRGMHRSSANAKLPEKKMRKRIWWSLYLRDRQCAAALGLPSRIRDDDCDVEELDFSDFEEDGTPAHPEVFGTQTMEHITYAIQMGKLAIFLGQIVNLEFMPNSNARAISSRSDLHNALVKWESELPTEMGYHATLGHRSSFWASMLHITHNNLYILLYRSTHLGAQENSDKDGSQIAVQAASKVTRIVEDMLSNDLLRYGQVHLITAIFNTLCIHTVTLCRSGNTARKLAEHRAHLCLLGLKDLQQTWDLSNWVLELFFQFIDRSIAERLRLVDEEEPAEQLTVADRTDDFDGSGISMIHENMHDPVLNGDNYSMDIPATHPPGLTPNMGHHPELFDGGDLDDLAKFQLCPALFGPGFYGQDIHQQNAWTLPDKDGLSSSDVAYLTRCL